MVTTFTYRPSLVKIDACNFDVGCRYQTCLTHATVHTTGCNTVKLTVYTRWSVLTPRCHTGCNTGFNADQPVYTPFYACSCHRTLSSVSGEHRATSHTVAFRSATVIFRLLCIADKDQVRRAGLLLRRPVCVEHTAAPYPRNSRFR